MAGSSRLQPQRLLVRVAPVRAGPRDVPSTRRWHRSQRRACLRPARGRLRHPGALPVGAARQLQLERVSGRRRRRGSRALRALEPVDHPRRGDPAALQRRGRRLSYSLEPQFPADTIDALQNIPWNWSSGELSAIVVGPDGARVDLGTAAFVAKSGNGPTTKKTSFTAWQPQMYGRYTVTATGWIDDAFGRRYAAAARTASGSRSG